MNGEFPGSEYIQGPNFGFPQGTHGRRGFPIKYIVIHGTGWPETFDQYLAEAPKTGGVHYMIAKDGRVAQFIKEADASWGNGKIEAGADAFWSLWKTTDKEAMTIPGIVDPNLTTISIEHEKYSKTNTDILTAAQQDASFKLVDYLCSKYSIPRKVADGIDGGIVGHKSMEPVTRSYCPGPYPWTDLISYLNKGETMTVPTGWKDDGKNTLTAPNGVVVANGFRLYVLAHTWQANNQPKKVEYSTGASSSRQDFDCLSLGWDSVNNVQLIAVNDEVAAVDAKTQAALALYNAVVAVVNG